MKTILGKQPAFWLGVLQAILAFVLTIHSVAIELHLTDERVGAIMAVLFGVLGVYEAWLVRDTMLAVLTAMAKSVIALLIVYGLEVSPETAAAALGLVAILAGVFIRDRTSPLVVPSFSSTEDSPVLTKGNLSLVA
jgi:hypothetical protein